MAFVESCFLMFSSDSLSLLGESDEYLEQDGYLEEEEMMSGEDLMQGTINGNRHQFKRRRIFRAPRERQRGNPATKLNTSIPLVNHRLSYNSRLTLLSILVPQ